MFYWGINATYELSELAEWVDLTQASKRNLEASDAFALGRNCYLFDKLRKYAYKSIKDYRGGKVEQWRNHILSKTIELNVFSEPLPLSEVKAIAKSVANWVWKHMRHDTQAFRQLQAMRGRKGGVQSGQSRVSKSSNQKQAAKILKNEGMALSEIARTLDISDRTIRRWKLE